MLYRKIEPRIEANLKDPDSKILMVDGARQVGKSYIIRHLGSKLFANYIEINLLEDSIGARTFADVFTTDDFYLHLSMQAGSQMGSASDTLIFLDEIQAYPQLLSLLKFLRQEGKFRYIASGSLLGVTLAKTTSIPMGSIEIEHMYPLDFEEFLLANDFGTLAVDSMRKRFEASESLSATVHAKVIDLFRKYLLVGGLPDAVNSFLKTKNIVKIRDIQSETHDYYGIDAAKYDADNRLKIRNIYDLIPSQMENKKKRIVAKDIEQKENARFAQYRDEFDYLISFGIALDVKAISNPKFPLIESAVKNLVKLYLNDVGILTDLLYRTNVKPILDDVRSINLGSVYENVVACELKAHGYELYYYDNKKKGEVDFVVDDYDTLSILPIEIKSGKDYTVHSALTQMLQSDEYTVERAIVFSNEREVRNEGKITYMPIYYVMFLNATPTADPGLFD